MRMRENLPPGPKPGPRKAADGTLCPPGSEPGNYRAERPYLRVCRKGHPKPHPGRCVPCRRASDLARDGQGKRKRVKRAAQGRWKAKPGSKEKTATWAHRRNQRPEQKRKGTLYMRKRRKTHPPAHVAKWTRYRGPIPKGKFIAFKDGNRKNISMQNMELVNRRQWIHWAMIGKYPKELIVTMQTLGRLRKAIGEADGRR